MYEGVHIIFSTFPSKIHCLSFPGQSLSSPLASLTSMCPTALSMFSSSLFLFLLWVDHTSWCREPARVQKLVQSTILSWPSQRAKAIVRRPKAAEVGRRRSVAGISSTSDGQLPIRSWAGPHHYGVAPPPPFLPLRVRPRIGGTATWPRSAEGHRPELSIHSILLHYPHRRHTPTWKDKLTKPNKALRKPLKRLDPRGHHLITVPLSLRGHMGAQVVLGVTNTCSSLCSLMMVGEMAKRKWMVRVSHFVSTPPHLSSFWLVTLKLLSLFRAWLIIAALRGLWFTYYWDVWKAALTGCKLEAMMCSNDKSVIRPSCH